jgi:hypothetical protein
MAADAALDQQYEQFVAALQRTPLWTEYETCQKRQRPDCEAVWIRATYYGLSLDSLARHALSDRLLDDAGPRALQGAVERQLLSAEPLRRIATLALLNMNPRLQSDLVLPYEAYHDLRSKSVVEIQLLLEKHVGLPLPYPETAAELSSIATDHSFDERARGAAAHALAHFEDAAELLHVTQQWLAADGADMLNANVLFDALSRCGVPCTEGLQQMAEDARPEVRQHALESIAAKE